MKVAILGGTPGSCLAEDRELKPKTMVEIGGKPILWHILMHYAYYGHEEFVIALGPRGEVIKKYILDYSALNRDLSVSLKTGKVWMKAGAVPDWTVEDRLWESGKAPWKTWSDAWPEKISPGRTNRNRTMGVGSGT